VERRLAAVLAADVVGYSRLMGEDEAGTLNALKGLRKELVAPEITKHKGRIVKLMGDAFLGSARSAKPTTDIISDQSVVVEIDEERRMPVSAAIGTK